jgi:ribonuclease HI
MIIPTFSNLKYTSTGVTDWVHKWKRNGFITSNGQPVKNADLWRDLDAARCAAEDAGIAVIFEWVKGHDGNHGNEQADKLAVAGIDNM